MSHLLARLRSAFATPVPTPDVELLSRYLECNDQDAFAELVRRYGPMVLGVCRRTLGHGPDVEDAYQAVFLVLAKRAATVRGNGQVGGWLHGVAAITAKKARVRRTKRRQREQAGGLLADVPTTDSPLSAELTAVIDEELGEGVVQLALAPDGKTVAAVRAFTDTTLFGNSGRTLFNLELFVFDVTAPPEKPKALWSARGLLSDAKTFNGPASLAFSPDGKTLLAAFADPYIADNPKERGLVLKSMGVKVWELKAKK